MSVQYLTDEHGKRLSVVLPTEVYEKLFEELEDVRLYDEAKAALERGEDELTPWDKVKESIGTEYEDPGRAIPPVKGGSKMGVQYLTDEHGERVSVLLSVEEYKRLLETEEQLEDILARGAYDRAVEELERGEDEVIPLEQAIREIREGKVPEE